MDSRALAQLGDSPAAKQLIMGSSDYGYGHQLHMVQLCGEREFIANVPELDKKRVSEIIELVAKSSRYEIPTKSREKCASNSDQWGAFKDGYYEAMVVYLKKRLLHPTDEKREQEILNDIDRVYFKD